jgi:hypothetical protein
MMRSRTAKIRKTDLCWCGSGDTYENCHWNRKRQKYLPFKAISNAMRTAWKHKDCLHPLASADVCDKIISAHSLQRSGGLEQIVDSSNHVCTFHPMSQRDHELRVQRVGWHEASTFTGFCSKHDTFTFAPLETEAFTGTEEQCFLIAYRAVCHEVYQKTGMLKSSPISRRLVDRGLPVPYQMQIQREWDATDAGAKAGLAAFRELKQQMDEQLLKKDYSGWSRVIINFRGDLCLLSTGLVSPNRDLARRKLQVLHDLSAKQESLPFGVVATADGGAVVLMWPESHTAPRLFVESMLSRGVERLPSLLVQFIFAYVENTYFSSRCWNSVPDGDQQHLASLAEISNPYYTDFLYISSPFVPWQITDIRIENTTAPYPPRLATQSSVLGA